MLKNNLEELRNLLRKVSVARDNECKWISHELHDNIGQKLAALKINTTLLRKKIVINKNTDSDSTDEEFNSILGLIEDVLLSIKKISTKFFPEALHHDGIQNAIKWKAKAFESKTGIRCIVRELNYKPMNNDSLTMAIYRIMDDVFTNIETLAEATLVHLVLGTLDDSYCIEINDNGSSIWRDESDRINSAALISISEQVKILNGSMRITGSPGKGTIVSLKIPY